MILGLDVEENPRPQLGRTAASYRAERAQKQAKKAKETLTLEEAHLSLDWESKMNRSSWMRATRNPDKKHPSTPATPNHGLLSTTIFEEEDSSEAKFD